MTKQSKIIIPFFIIAIILIGIYFHFLKKNLSTSGVSSITPTTANQIKNWNTYTNTKYNYSLEYPTTWEVQSPGRAAIAESDGPIFQTPDCINKKIRCGTVQVTANLLKNITVEAYDSKKYYDTTYGTNQDTNVKAVSEKAITFAGVPAYERIFWQNIDSNGVKPELYKYIVFVHDKISYVISLYEGYFNDTYNIKSLSDWQNTMTFDHMLLTFKFAK